MENHFKIRGKQLYTEILGQDNNPDVLFIHGGPGGIGCADFVQYQGTLLSKKLHLVTLDQRGVWRSEQIDDDQTICFEDMIEDFETLRKKLHIHKWSLISHSFGGYLSVLYATMYPESIESIIYENPSFDFSLSERYMLKASIQLLEKLGQIKEANTFKTELTNANSYQRVNQLLMNAGQVLKNNCNKIMLYSDNNQIIEQLAMHTKNGGTYWNRSMNTRNRLLQDGRAYTDVFDQLDAISNPSLLIKGQSDSITDQIQIDRFIKSHSNRKVIYFEKSGHYAHIEEAQKYAETVIEYILYLHSNH